MQKYALWQRTLQPQGDDLDPQRALLCQSFLEFRENVKQLVGEIGGLLPELTVHDITHLDALWRIADQVAGSDYPINPAEAFVLGGAFLLHDAAHVLAAYPAKIEGIKTTTEWKDLIAQWMEGKDPAAGSAEERAALFQILRQLHASQAHNLPKISWQVPQSAERIYLISNPTLRDYYGDLIGEIAESHHWSPNRLADEFSKRFIAAPAFIYPATWEVDALKIAFLLRTADAAHIDGLRAPWFLFALRYPQGISESHWRFQAKMGQPSRTSSGELRISSGNPFQYAERQAWWLAFDTAKMIDSELRAAQIIMRETGRQVFATTGVLHVATPASFSLDVRTSGWEPVHVQPTIRDVSKVIRNFGGAKLYGDKPELAVRELIQNSVDAINALRAVGQLGPEEGRIEIALTKELGQIWLHVTDQGVGMSRYVLTEILPDFGTSLWNSESVRSEIPGLISSGFKPIGKFGIGFYSVFMLGGHVRVTTRRFRKKTGDTSDQWLLEFENHLSGRPTLRRPTNEEELVRAGTRVSVAISDAQLKGLVLANEDIWRIEGLPTFGNISEAETLEKSSQKKPANFGLAIANLCPTLDIQVTVRVESQKIQTAVNPNDWKTLPSETLLERLYFRDSRTKTYQQLTDLREKSGELVGRISLSDKYYSSAYITHKGIRSGEIRYFEGVILGFNNIDLARAMAVPVATIDEWRDWAKVWLSTRKKPSLREMTLIHPLCPNEDFPLFTIDGEALTEMELIEWLAPLSEVPVHRNVPEYEESEDISESKFNNNFQTSSRLLIYPSDQPALAKSFEVPEISYLERLEAILKKAWGDFYEDSDTESVGDVLDTDIMRSITIYKRADE